MSLSECITIFRRIIFLGKEKSVNVGDSKESI